MNEAMFRLPSGSSAAFSSATTSSRSPFLPTSLDNLVLSADNNQLTSNLATQPEDKSAKPAIKKRKVVAEREPLASVRPASDPPARVETAEEKAKRERRLLSK